MGGYFHHALAGFDGCPGDVGSDGEVFCVEEGVLAGDGFPGDDVAGGACDLVGVECVRECLFFDEGSAGGVDEEGGGFHGGECRGVYHALAFRGEGAVEGNDVGFFVNFRDGGPLEGEVRGGGPGAGVAEDLHVEGVCEGGGALADAAEADDADGFSCEFVKVWIIPEGEVGGVLPFSLLDEVVVVGGAFEEVEDEGEDELCDGVCGVDRDVGDGDVIGGAVGGIDGVVAGGEDGDEPEVGELGEGFCREGAFVGENDFGIVGAFDNFIDRCAGMDGECAEGFDGGPWVVAGVEGVAIEDGDFHGGRGGMD